MEDLLIGVSIILMLALALFLLGLIVGRAAPRWVSTGLALLAILGMIVYIRELWDNVLLARLLPYSNLIVLGNWFPLVAGLLGGLAWRRIPGGGPKKGAYVAALTGIALVTLAVPLWGEPPQCRNLWSNGVCLQTSSQTCSAASAATLLSQYGIDTTEQEMAELCLTRRGTYWQGLYRGLKRKTFGTRWDVEVFEGDLDELRRRVQDGPVILTVGIPRNADVDPIYTTRDGWRPGLLHSVILFRFLPRRRVLIGDPSIDGGLEPWTLADLDVLWRGRGLQLVERHPYESWHGP